MAPKAVESGHSPDIAACGNLKTRKSAYRCPDPALFGGNTIDPGGRTADTSARIPVRRIA